jgi:antitoxin ParD1/3/4
MEGQMVTRNVVLASEQADLVERLVSAGRYQNASEALRAGLRLLEREEIEAIELRKRLLTSLRQAQNGELVDGSGQSVVRSAFSAAQHSEK